MVVLFRLDALGKHQIDYKVGYSFGLDDNSWQVEFYNQDNIRFEKDSPNFLMKRFKELDKNLGDYKFYKHCGKPGCCRYNYSSTIFRLDYKHGKLGSLSNSPVMTVGMEYIGMSSPTEDGYKVYKLLNDYKSSRSTLIFGKHPSELITRSDWGMHNPPIDTLGIIQTSLIKFSSKEETMERVSKLIVFS